MILLVKMWLTVRTFEMCGMFGLETISGVAIIGFQKSAVLCCFGGSRVCSYSKGKYDDKKVLPSI
jgi:hypothetical protein